MGNTFRVVSNVMSGAIDLGEHSSKTILNLNDLPCQQIKITLKIFGEAQDNINLSVTLLSKVGSC